MYNMCTCISIIHTHTQDTPYPTFLYQVLEECWQQEQFRRPPAELLHTALVRLTGLSVRGVRGQPIHTTHSLLLDSYLLYHSSRLSVIHSVVDGNGVDEGSRFVACAALSSLADNCTSIIALTLSHQQCIEDCRVSTKVYNVPVNNIYIMHMLCHVHSMLVGCKYNYICPLGTRQDYIADES